MHTGATVYGKTGKGRSEIEARNNALTAKERRVLILVDARRSQTEIGLATGMRQEVNTLLSRLREDGFIEVIYGATASIKAKMQAISAPAAVPIEQPKTGPGRLVDADALVLAKQIMMKASRQHLGLFGVDLERHIDAAKNRESLASCVAKWNMAMRESLSGRSSVDDCLGRIRTLLGQELG